MEYNTHNNEYEFARGYFLPDEYELWRGKSKGMDPHPKMIMIPFGIIFIAFALVWTVGASAVGGPFGLFGLPFIAVGAYIVFGKNIVGKKTYYVITNKKIYRSQAGRVDMVDLANLPPMRMTGHSNGAGSIYFGEHHYRSNGRNHYGVVFSIENVDNIAEVQRIISEQIRN
jgi:hypothetical protein